jgi:hypothetical protein
MPSDSQKKQVNFRVTADEWDILRAIANVDETTVPAAAYQIVQRGLAQAAKDKHVRADIANRASARARGDQVVVPMDRSRRGPTTPA